MCPRINYEKLYFFYKARSYGENGNHEETIDSLTYEW